MIKLKDKKNILLVGFMAVGKSTISRLLAKELNTFVVDTDDIIENLEHKKIKDIFESDGEAHFRTLEKDCAEWLENSVSGSVIATGGGFYKVPNIKNIGKIIYLQSSFEKIIERINSYKNAEEMISKRPLLQNLEKAKALYNSRISDYEKIADYIINIEDLSYEKVVEKIIDTI